MLAVGEAEAAVRLGLEVARRQLAEGSFTDAMELLSSLKTAAGHPGLEGRVRAEYHLLLGRAVRSVRPMDAAGMKALSTALDEADAPALKARVHLAFADLYAAIGHPGNYRKHLAAAVSTCAAVSPCRRVANEAHVALASPENSRAGHRRRPPQVLVEYDSRWSARSATGPPTNRFSQFDGSR